MIKWIYIIVYMLICVLIQTLFVHNIQLFGIVTPFIYLYAILKFPFDMKRSSVILCAFFLGLVIDGFSNTFGIHAAACSLVGFIRNPLLERFIDFKEIPDRSIPSYKILGFVKFFYYTFILVTIHHIILFSIDSFGFFQPFRLIVRMLSSMLLTSLLIFIVEAFNLRKIRYGE